MNEVSVLEAFLVDVLPLRESSLSVDNRGTLTSDGLSRSGICPCGSPAYDSTRVRAKYRSICTTL